MEAAPAAGRVPVAVPVSGPAYAAASQQPPVARPCHAVSNGSHGSAAAAALSPRSNPRHSGGMPACYADVANATESWDAGYSMGHSNTDSAGHSFDWQLAQRNVSQGALSEHSAYSAATYGSDVASDVCASSSQHESGVCESGDRRGSRQSRSKTERQARRARRRTMDGQTIVTTPWFPDGAIKDQVTLASEVTALAALLQLNAKERGARTSLRSTLQGAAQRWWPESTVKMYGSYAYDCSLPDSALDLVCENCVDLSRFASAVRHISQERNLQIEHLYEGSAGGERQAFAKLRGQECGVVANVTFVEGRSPARQAVSAVQKLLAKYPSARDVFAVVRQVLRQSKVADAADGGLAPYAVLLMVLHAAQRSSAPEDPGQLLVDFFTLYSAPSPTAIDARSTTGGSAPKGCPLWVCDLVGEGNVADGCTKAPQVHAVCLHCASTLGKWSTGQWQGYRGRSPLSSILAYDVLWERANA